MLADDFKSLCGAPQTIVCGPNRTSILFGVLGARGEEAILTDHGPSAPLEIPQSRAACEEALNLTR